LATTISGGPIRSPRSTISGTGPSGSCAPVQDVACLGGLTMDGDLLQLILELRDLVDVLAAWRTGLLA
jgi:hypothetical protein